MTLETHITAINFDTVSERELGNLASELNALEPAYGQQATIATDAAFLNAFADILPMFGVFALAAFALSACAIMLPGTIRNILD